MPCTGSQFDLLPQRQLARWRRGSFPRGMTLIELLLVLTLLAMAASLVVPAMKGAMENARLNAGGDQVRTALGKARLAAMKTGRMQVFRFQPGGSIYRIEPWISESDATELSPDAVKPTERMDSIDANKGDQSGLAAQPGGGAPGTFAVTGDPNSGDATIEGRLPDGIIFVDQQIEASTRAEEVEEAVASDTNWSLPIVFHPDGTTSTARVYVMNRMQRGKQIDLRGLTGVTTVQTLEAGMVPMGQASMANAPAGVTP